MEKIKAVAKYATNVIAILMALVTGINGVEGITIPYASQIVGVLAVVQGIIGTYLLTNKALSVREEADENEQH